MAERLGELQVLSSRVTSHGPAMSLASLPEFVAETESKGPPLPWSFLVRSLEEFVGTSLRDVFFVLYKLSGLIYVSSSTAPRPRSLLVSPRRPTCSLSKNALSFFSQQVILDSGHGGGCLTS